MFWNWGKQRLYIYDSERQLIAAESERNRTRETGGSLFGTFTHSEMPIVWLASGPGLRAILRNTHFEQDADFITRWQRRLNERFGIHYIGGWHSHHTLGLRRPSQGDVQAARVYARRHHRRKNVEIIVTLEAGFEAHLWPFVYTDASRGDHREGELVILPGESPLRSKLAEGTEEFSGATPVPPLEDEERGAIRIARRSAAVTPRTEHTVKGQEPCADVAHAADRTPEGTSVRRDENDIERDPEALPDTLQLEIDRLCKHGAHLQEIDIEHRPPLWMVTLPLGRHERGFLLAVALEEDRHSNIWIRQVSLIDSERGLRDLTRLISDGLGNLLETPIEGHHFEALYRISMGIL